MVFCFNRAIVLKSRNLFFVKKILKVITAFRKLKIPVLKVHISFKLFVRNYSITWHSYLLSALHSTYPFKRSLLIYVWINLNNSVINGNPEQCLRSFKFLNHHYIMHKSLFHTNFYRKILYKINSLKVCCFNLLLRKM